MVKQRRKGSVMAKGKVSEQEIWAMKGMYSDGLSVKEIAAELSRSEPTVEKYLDVKEKEKEEVPQEKSSNNTTQFIKRSAAKNNKGVTIMTDAESSRSELTRSKRQSKITNRAAKTIHKIN